MSEHYPHMTLLLIRHGQARARDGSYDEYTPLSDFGRSQAARLAHALGVGTTPTIVYTSPLPRALETAAPLCQKLNLEPVVDARLAEFDLGSNPFEVVQLRPDLVVWQAEHRGVEHGETLGAFTARVAAFCDEVVARHPDTVVAVVAHAGTIDAALRWAVGLPPPSPWLHEFDLAPASITTVDFWPRGRVDGGAPRYAVIGRVGDVTHLGDLVSDL